MTADNNNNSTMALAPNGNYDMFDAILRGHVNEAACAFGDRVIGRGDDGRLDVGCGVTLEMARRLRNPTTAWPRGLINTSQCNVFTRSKSQGQGPSHGQLSCATRAGRVEERVVCRVVGDSINDEDRHIVPELSQPLVWTCDMRHVIGQ